MCSYIYIKKQESHENNDRAVQCRTEVETSLGSAAHTTHTLGESLQALYTCGKCPRFASQGTTEVYGYFKQWKLLFCSSEILSTVSQLTSQHRCQVAGVHLHDLRPGHGERGGRCPRSAVFHSKAPLNSCTTGLRLSGESQRQDSTADAKTGEAPAALP